MSNKAQRETRAPSGPGDLSQMVADLTKMAVDVVSDFSGYDLSTCDLKIAELTQYLINPTGPQQTIPQILGQLTLLYEQKAKMQIQEHAEELMAMQAVCRAEQESNSHLRHVLKETQEDHDQARQECETLRTQVREDHVQAMQECETLRTQVREDHDQARQECETLHAQVQVQDQEERGDSQRGLASPELMPLSTGSGADIIRASGTVTLGEQFTLLWRVQHTQQTPTLASVTSRGEQKATPGSAATWNYQATPAHPARSHPAPDHDDDDGYESEDSDGPAPPRREGICTRQLESPAKDVERFDPNSQSNRDDYLREVERCPLDSTNPLSREELEQGVTQNQGGEGSNQPHNQGRPWDPHTSQQRGGDWSDRKPHQHRPFRQQGFTQNQGGEDAKQPHQYQEYRYGDRNPKHGMHPGMVDLMRCVTKARTNLGVPDPPASPKKSDTKPHRQD